MNELDPETVQKRLEAGEIMLVDVREPHEFSEARIEGAFNYPLSTFSPDALPVDGKRDIVLHCGTGKRSGMALDRCCDAKVDGVAHMAGGLTAWRAGGLPVVAVDPSTGQLKRQ